ncbi:MAG TPA: hypothetical protein VGE49_03945 [Brevundimonas sp.]
MRVQDGAGWLAGWLRPPGQTARIARKVKTGTGRVAAAPAT